MFETVLNDHMSCIRHLAEMTDTIEDAANALAKVVSSGGRVFICGNGGSAADAQHFAAELMGRFEMERRAVPAVALTTDTSIITAVANDYSFDDIFARQLAGLARSGDALVGISTSGNSANVLKAVRLATEMDLKIVTLSGGSGGKLANQADHEIVIRADNTARIQEAHALILHFFAQVIEKTAGVNGNG